jgi:hypothetical protein
MSKMVVYEEVDHMLCMRQHICYQQSDMFRHSRDALTQELLDGMPGVGGQPLQLRALPA